MTLTVKNAGRVLVISDDQTELEMILKVDEWPNWPYLPLKMPSEALGEFPAFATLLDEVYPRNSYKLIHRSLFQDKDLKAFEEGGRSSSVTAEAVIALGWRVD